MAYRRHGRPTYYFGAKTRHGFTALSTGTPDRRLALKIETMWTDLAVDHRAWDVLDQVLGNALKIGKLFDIYRDTGGSLGEIRRRLSDVNLEPLIAEFLTVWRTRGIKADSIAHIEQHLRELMPAGVIFPRSDATAEILTQRLAAYRSPHRKQPLRAKQPVRRRATAAPAPATLRKVHSSWSVFFGYCTRPKKLFDRNPMDDVDRAKAKKPMPRFYELDVVERIVGWQPTAERRAVVALLYGTGIESSVVLSRTRAHVNPSSREIHAEGEKAHKRNRLARIADWAWPIFWSYAKSLLPTAPLFPKDWTRHTLHDFNREAIAALKIQPVYPIYNARHHWAVLRLRAGAPLRVVQEQLGHSTGKLTLDTYALWVTSGAERARAEEQVTAYETTRRQAQNT